MALYIIIMAGGKGERLWPLSCEGMPKQLLSFGMDRSLLRSTVDRTARLASKEHIYVVTNGSIADKVREQLPDIPAANILAEPVGRNTAPCIAYAAAKISLADPDAVMGVFPSDHIISNPEEFESAVKFGLDALNTHRDLLITLGIVPTHPETGYGYIDPGEVLKQDKNLRLCRITSFHEKPDRQTAGEYIEKGCLWNAGMFLWRADAILKEFSTLMPGMYVHLGELMASMMEKTDDIAAFYEKVEPVSIDYGIMEKTHNAAVIPAEFGWNDIGSWDAIGKILPGDASANVTVGSVVMQEAVSNVVFSTDKKIVVMGTHDLVVVEGRDAILVCPRSRAQEVSTLIKNMKG